MLVVVAFAVPNEMGAPAVLSVAGEGVITNAVAFMNPFAGVVAKHLLAIRGPAAIAVLLSTAVFDWAGASPA